MTTKPPIQVGVTPRFLKAAKRLRRKYPQVGSGVQRLMDTLAEGETPGDQIQGVGYAAYKVRLQNPDAQRGKSGGFRVVYYIRRADRVTLVMIYSKTEQVDISPEEIRHLIDEFENPSCNIAPCSSASFSTRYAVFVIISDTRTRLRVYLPSCSLRFMHFDF